MGKTVQIAIVGGSGSGKTWLAEKLYSGLAPKAARLSLDDFYRDLSGMAARDRDQVNFDEPAAIDWESVRAATAALSRGEPAEVPRYDFATHTRGLETRTVPARDFLVWEGLWLLHEEWLREQFGFSVFVDCGREARLERRIARDVRERGRSPESVRRQFEWQVEPMHEQHVEPQRRRATCRVVSPVSEPTVRRLLAQAQACAVEPEPSTTNWR